MIDNPPPKNRLDSAPHSLADLIEVAERKNWCTKIVCTTCGAIPFRTALRGIPREDVVAGLRQLSSEFLGSHREMFRLIVRETAYFPIGGDLIDPLAGTPAEAQLRADIDRQNLRSEKRKAYLATQTPEAIAQRRAEKRTAKALATAPHREAKLASQQAIRDAARILQSTPVDNILHLIVTKDFGVPLRAIGGLTYNRLKEHYETTPIGRDHIDALTKLAAVHSGYWMKLLARFS